MSESTTSGLSLDTLSERAAAAFRARYGRAPAWMAAAPGRVNVIGEHVDYNQGIVLPMAIERWVVAAAGPNQSRTVRLWSDELKRSCEFNLDAPWTPLSGWASYPQGVLAGFSRRGTSLEGCDVLLVSNVPVGGGVSSSAALEVATATLVEAMTGMRLPALDKALLCQKAEQEFAGVPCGLMDQIASAASKEDHLTLLDCRSQTWRHVPVAAPCRNLMIINTKVKHRLQDGAYANRRRRCEETARQLGAASLREVDANTLEQAQNQLSAEGFRRARHVVTEIARTVETAAAIEAGDWNRAGRLMYESHRSLQKDFEVSCAELDLVVEIAQSIGETGGVFGCRMTGGGFGGCAVCLLHESAADSASAVFRERYIAGTGLDPDIFLSRPAAGSIILDADAV